MTRKNDDYEIGYGKPPESGRFTKGTSGNSKGRPPGARNFTTDVEEVLNARVAVMENGRKAKVSSQMATLLRLRENALKGNLRATELLLGFARDVESRQAAAGTERSLSASEQEILQRFAADILRQGPALNEPDADGETDEQP